MSDGLRNDEMKYKILSSISISFSIAGIRILGYNLFYKEVKTSKGTGHFVYKTGVSE